MSASLELQKKRSVMFLSFCPSGQYKTSNRHKKMLEEWLNKKKEGGRRMV